MIVDSIIYGLTKIECRDVITHNFIRSDYKSKQWLASIEGICKEYGFKRTFVNSVKSKAHSFMMAKFTYDVEVGKVYQYKGFLVDTDSKLFYDGFFAITDRGVLELEYEEIRNLLRMPVKGWKNFGERKIKRIEGNYTVDDIPF